MCYFNNKNASDVTERETLQQAVINGSLNLDFYSRLKQLNLLSESCKNENIFIDAEGIIRKNLVAFLVLLNSDAIIKTKINNTEYLYKLNEFLFEMTLCENICCFLKASKNKIIYLKVIFLKNKFIIQIKYNGKKIQPRSYCNNVKTSFKRGVVFKTALITFNCESLKTKKPSKLNLDGIS